MKKLYTFASSAFGLALSIPALLLGMLFAALTTPQKRLRPVLAFLALVLLMGSNLQADSLTGLSGGIYVGKDSDGDGMAVTGVASVDEEIPFGNFRQLDGVLPVGVSLTVLVPGTALASTEAYNCQATGLTNTPAICFPASDTATFSVTYKVPGNYRSGGVLVLGLHTSAALTENVSITADVYSNSYASATTVAKVAGTLTALTNASLPAVRLVKVEAANSKTYVAGEKITWKVTIAGTTAIKQLTEAAFRYRPYGLARQASN